jgi:hypothetical protein
MGARTAAETAGWSESNARPRALLPRGTALHYLAGENLECLRHPDRTIDDGHPLTLFPSRDAPAERSSGSRAHSARK